MGKHGSQAGVEAELKALRRRRWTPDDARYVLAAWVGSRLRLETFARRHELVPQRLRWWRKHLKHWDGKPAASPATGLVPAVIVDAPGCEVSSAEVVAGMIAELPPVVVRLPGAVTVEVGSPTQVSPHWVAALVAALDTAR